MEVVEQKPTHPSSLSPVWTDPFLVPLSCPEDAVHLEQVGIVQML